MDVRSGHIEGELTVRAGKASFDVEWYQLYFTNDKKEILPNPPMPRVGLDSSATVSMVVPEGATHLMACPGNKHGEGDRSHCLTEKLNDAVLPGSPPAGVYLLDTSPEVGELGGTIEISPALAVPGDEYATKSITHYALHWGKSSKHKLQGRKGGSLIHEVPAPVSGGGNSTWYMAQGTKIPSGATHILAFSKSSSAGDYTKAWASTLIVDRSRPGSDGLRKAKVGT